MHAWTIYGESCVTDAAKDPEMKPEQLEVADNFIEGRYVFFQFCLLALARVYVTLACL